MILNFIRTIQTESISRFPLDEPVDEVSSFDAPARRDLLSFDLHLFCENVVSDIFSGLAHVWSLYLHYTTMLTLPIMHSYPMTPTAK
jgi:hypothetical protein